MLGRLEDGFTPGKSAIVDEGAALPGRATPIRISGTHFVNGHTIVPPFPEGLEVAVFGEGCFWGAERGFWKLPGVYSTAVGYAGGYTPNPTYEEVCSGRTGHAEVVLVAFDPRDVTYEQLLVQFWESHDPTQGMRQGNDRGTQYRSAIYTTGEGQAAQAADSAARYASALADAGYGAVTTEIAPLDGPLGHGSRRFFYAEDYHQQYLAKNPNGYCGLGGTSVSCPIGLDVTPGDPAQA
ncbi:peptide-methionine (S)-S-oxide reductase [Mycobacteroides saopaulense]|uniref:Peptide methionine sulfoxide reductase MsrA n=1 Tax=Mycobacteroides saopaulense TaxID=1578165 RepID=A0ABX3C0P9_9MYCO|nr:peptide-methionine (S)-S-oxide reductase [Mycobacteroides saopaulense]OHU10058.1 peptide-methionine (S)-S-oxide reductase [Mycobacteroides saopaulense]